MNETKIKNERIDGLLSKYFQTEMPDPWPSFQAPEASSVLPMGRSRWLTYRRIAVAACLAALLAGYLALAGYFPRETPGSLGGDPSRNIGRNPGPGVKTVQPNP
jgi:hypothetical protein